MKRIGLVLAALLIVAGVSTYHRFSRSLPKLDGEIELAGLSAPVTLERDALGVATLRGANRMDLSRALGFVHAQERFFQMDLMRRSAAGELAALLGKDALSIDRSRRIHRMRARAERVLTRAGPRERELVTSYADGVNAGLASLGASPFEYLLLRQQPSPWTPEDSVLVVYSMFFQLNDETGRDDADVGLMFDVLPRELAEFLTPAGTEWDAPVEGEPLEVAPIPAVDSGGEVGAERPSDHDPTSELGSNNWVVSGKKTAHGGAILASDMHLGHAVPNIWFRALLEWGANRIVGVTLPGTPSLVAGSNGHIAWGFTNSNGDWVDLVEIEVDDDDPGRYRTPAGWESFVVHHERIDVEGAEPELLEVRETIWGPLIDEDHRGRPRAVRWIAHDARAVNMELGKLETTDDLDEALRVAGGSGIPPQNFVCADRGGAIGWTIAGAIPRRAGFDGRLPGSWADGARRWDGYLAPEEHPRIVDPETGAIWTANARVVGGDALDAIGDGGYSLGARARQIRDSLLSLELASEADMLAIQLDDRALLLERWRTLFLEILRERENLVNVRRFIDESWTGRASIDSVGYRLVRDLRQAVFEHVIGALTEPARQADERFRLSGLRQWEGPLWKLVTEKPPHLVPHPYRSWEEALAGIVARRASQWTEPLSTRTWGARNVSAIRHPLSPAIPLLSRWLDMPERALPGDSDMPRVQSPSHGASERLVVAPGREEQGLFHMPGGQSGHPLSPYYGAGHEDWEEGRPTPLLPGPTRYELVLTPSP
ncbi:MAG TPA: penicillin acylase family protein [Vicinamibacteria bacterium]|nr:penicillin acylase family protein [Vicinamibacteria bacterium]